MGIGIPTEKKPEWVTRKGGGGKRYQVVSVHDGYFSIYKELKDNTLTLYVPATDYKPCPPPVEDVTSRLYIDNGKVKKEVPCWRRKIGFVHTLRTH